MVWLGVLTSQARNAVRRHALRPSCRLFVLGSVSVGVGGVQTVLVTFSLLVRSFILIPFIYLFVLSLSYICLFRPCYAILWSFIDIVYRFFLLFVCFSFLTSTVLFATLPISLIH